MPEPVPNGVEGGAAWAHHEHALVLRNERAECVHDRLGATGARQRLDHHGGARRDVRNHLFLLRIGIEQQAVGRRRTVI